MWTAQVVSKHYGRYIAQAKGATPCELANRLLADDKIWQDMHIYWAPKVAEKYFLNDIAIINFTTD